MSIKYSGWILCLKTLVVPSKTSYHFEVNWFFIQPSFYWKRFFRKKINNKKPRNHCSVNVTSIDCLYLLWFRKIAHTHIHLAGKKQSKHKSHQIKCSFSDWKVWVEPEYFLNLKSRDKRTYKEKSILSNGGLLPDPNVSISLLLICLWTWFCNLFSFSNTNTTTSVVN